MQDDIALGVPLHYAIPSQLFDCDSADDSTADLPPGQYAVLFAIVIHNQTAQQAQAIAPDVWIGSSADGATLDVSGGDMNGDDTGATWANGDCETNYYQTMNEGGSDALYGLIGPAIPAQLAASYVYVYVSWADGENNVPGTPPQLPLPSLLPHAGASWLIANTGTPLPSAAPNPSSSPTSCPSAPSSYDSSQQEAFNDGSDTWLGQVGQELQFDPAGTSPQQDATDWCKQDDVIVQDTTDTLGQLLPVCLAGVKAAGGP